jgi:copper chaperone CopZ
MRILWHRLRANPTTRVLSRDGDVTRLKVDGLVCDAVCAARTKRALEQIGGVRSVTVDLDSGVAAVVGARVGDGAYERAVASVVVGRPLRRIIERVVMFRDRRMEAAR